MPSTHLEGYVQQFDGCDVNATDDDVDQWSKVWFFGGCDNVTTAARGALATTPADALPSPATQAILTVLKAGERVFQTLLLARQCWVHFEGRNHCFMHFLASNTVRQSGTLLGPACNASGLRG